MENRDGMGKHARIRQCRGPSRTGRRRSPISAGTGGLGIGVVIIIFVISYFTGINPSVLFGGAQIFTGNGANTSASAPAPSTAQSPAAPKIA